MRRISILLAFLLLVLVGASQVAPGKYFIEFTDKNNSPYSIDRPWEFLTQRALDRRAIASIPIIENDLPVNPSYVDAVSQVGVEVLNRTRWFNGITIYTTDTSLLAIIEQLPFVSRIVKGKGAGGNGEPIAGKFLSPPVIPLKLYDSTDYGLSFTQVHMVGTDALHTLGFRGEGKVIAVLDAGFYKADILPVFDSLWEHNQILGTRDFVTAGGNVFTGHDHGMKVLSIMGGFMPGQLIGTAPKAGYWLLRSEDTGSEYLIEEYNWVSAAEFADSVGADIINSSLGYTVFDDSTMNHTCADITGNTTPVTRGANIAFSKGMLVVNSAGNEGNNPNWHCVSAPSDGFDVLGVGAVDSLGQYVPFSSTGVVNGSYVKPNVAAMGRLTVIAATDGTITRGNGTSFSSPVMAGSAACLWQAFPHYSNVTIKKAIEESGSLYTAPNIFLGYGIPNLYHAYQHLTGIEPSSRMSKASLFPNPSSGNEPVFLRLEVPVAQTVELRFFDRLGRLIHSQHGISCLPGTNTLQIDPLNFIGEGMFILMVSGQGLPHWQESVSVLRINQWD